MKMGAFQLHEQFKWQMEMPQPVGCLSKKVIPGFSLLPFAF
jgi:hypothetical protein